MNPETRDSLILRLSDANDAAAWEAFAAIYEPMLLRLARRWGLQDADARDLIQDVLAAVARSIERYEPQQQSGSFRGWLAQIARHKFADMLAGRKRQAVGSGQTDVHLWLAQLPDPSATASRWDWELRRELFQWAARVVAQATHRQTWEAFERTAIQGQPVAEVAKQLGISAGQVYVARSRVLSRLRQAVQAWSENDAL